MRKSRLPRFALVLTSLTSGIPLVAVPVPAAQDAKQPMPANAKKDKEQTDPFADQQKMNPADRANHAKRG